MRTHLRSGLSVIAVADGLGLMAVPPALAQPKRPCWCLGESVPASLDYDGPAGNHPASQTGFHNLIEPLVDYAPGKVEEGTQLLDFQQVRGRAC